MTFQSFPDADSLRDIYEEAHLCFLDSRVISLAARLCGLRPPRVVPGADLVEQLFREAITPATSICVVGGGDSVATSIRTLSNVGKISHIEPPIGFWRNEAELDRTAAFIVTSQADYTFLAVGSPQQEILAARVAAMGGARGVGICAGASIDFITGKQRRAPRFLQRFALEWAYRFCMEPRRLAGRYLVESPKGVFFVLRGALRLRRPAGLQPAPRDSGGRRVR
jgi:N-acetylglucosaminyldiphosphoundecaprenol N-acetyl-beta-D-mannosaminyltransferase